MDALEGGTLINEGGGNVELVHVHVEVVLSVGNSAAQNLLDNFSANLRRELQNRKCFSDVLATDEIHDHTNLARSDANVFSYCF